MNLENIKLLRTEKGYAQRDIAALLGVSQQAYSNYEAGRREPDLAALCNLANIFGVTVDYLLGRDDTPQPYLPLQSVALPAAPALTAEEQELVERFRELNPEGQTAALGALRLYAAMPEYKKPPVSRQIQEIG